jgi:hypothetical protein
MTLHFAVIAQPNKEQDGVPAGVYPQMSFIGEGNDTLLKNRL